MSDPIEFFFDFSSPYGFIASTLIDDIASKHGRGVIWRPFLIGAVYKEHGGAPLDHPMKSGEKITYYWLPGRMDLSSCPDSSDCADGLAVFSRTLFHDHEIVHVLLRDLGRSQTFLYEGMAEAFGRAGGGCGQTPGAADRLRGSRIVHATNGATAPGHADRHRPGGHQCQRHHRHRRQQVQRQGLEPTHAIEVHCGQAAACAYE